MTFTDAQYDMRRAYYGGATGLFASSLVWLAAGVVAVWVDPQTAVWALLGGGMLIHPMAVALSKALGRSGSPDADNPLARLALEGTIWFLLTLALAYVISVYRVEWFFPAMLLMIGGRYLTFQTLYGLRAYWIGGAVLAAAGMALVIVGAPAHVGALCGAAIEGAMGAVIMAVDSKNEPEEQPEPLSA
jgi:F0F1-type ATP synthase assembly protein I